MKQEALIFSRWMEGTGPDKDIVISSRVRLARNLEGQPFPCLAADEITAAILKQVEDMVSGQNGFADFSFQMMEKTPVLEKQALVEKHLISPLLARGAKNGAVLLSKDEALSIMINEEDHLRIQAILPGLQTEEALKMANRCDDQLEKPLRYAFDEQYGYLTACPTNLGTGLRASVMLHLPALIMTGQVNRFLGVLSQVGLAVRGLYGEGSEIVGNLVQISNQVTLGQNENEIIGNLNSVMRQVIEQEQEARQALLDKKRAELADRAWRSLGLLKYAQVMSSHEAIQLISDLRLGFDLGLIKTVDHKLLNELLVLIRPGCLQLLAGKELSTAERNLERPVQIKKALEQFQVKE
ncbi:MAG: protein arginine kinase [Bacillota bacterium]|nr:protein arginine kinase [Bacillota bacterium]